MTRKTILLTAIAATALTLTACVGQDAEPSPSTTTMATPTGPYVLPSDTATAEPGDVEDDSLVNAEPDDNAKRGAQDAAIATATVWVQGKTLDQQAWNEQLLATIAPIAQPAYDTKTWGYRITQTAITGDPTLVDATMTTATVTVPTDDGDLTLTVARDDETSPWLTTSITTAQSDTATTDTPEG